MLSLGPYWKHRFSIPYVLDFQDEWVSDYYRDWPWVRPPGGRFKYGIARILARFQEKSVVMQAAQIVSVSSTYNRHLLDRYPKLTPSRLHVLPFGGDQADSPKEGGPSHAILAMVRALLARGIEVEIATTELGGIGPDELPVHFFPRISRGPGLLHRFGYAPGFASWLRKHLHRYNLLHVHALFSYPSTLAMRLARRAGIPYISRPLGQLGRWSLRQSPVRKWIYLALFEKQNLQHASALHFTSELERSEAAELRLLSSSFVIPHGIGLPEIFPEARLHLRTQLDVPKHHRIILFLGRIHPKKGLDLLVTALSALRHFPFTFVLAGEGNPVYQHKVKKLLGDHGLQSRTVLTGFVTGEFKQLCLQGSDLFVLTSRHENFGIAVLEALASGTPVLISDQVPLAKEVQENDLGKVTSLEAKSVTNALECFLKKSVKKEPARFRNYVATRYSWAANAQALELLYGAVSLRREKQAGRRAIRRRKSFGAPAGHDE